jgi:DNA-3-methyladenine glycosylase II
MKKVELLTPENFSRHAHKLAKEFPEFRSVVKRWGLPVFWRRKEGIDSLVRIILEQQISIVAAQSIYKRLRGSLGNISAKRIYAAGPDKLRSVGLTRQKSRYCYKIAEAVVERRLLLGSLAKMSDHAVVAALVELPGIGPWTASIYVMSALGRIDIWPPGDLALRNGIADLMPKVDTQALGDSGDRWRPRRAVAARLVWHHYRNCRSAIS